ncbi:hypothetical protein BTM25_17210 [Actinomadura rubteroloni]|uniref:Uncharacterized protein n=1 Tax=Actinomadura rubteroloni TaxID=1926885 RepID=A0A2P4UQI4_9ACTN|nr:hypothetical protein [Actinomadura rubteroloni]POM27308.1 hypothetical protein BTM25_17210 [Actinomadura rubteroloni]
MEWLFERLEQEEAAEQGRLESLKAQVESLQSQVKEAEDRLARLAITRHTALALRPEDPARQSRDERPGSIWTSGTLGNGGESAPNTKREDRRPLSGTNQRVVVLLAEVGRPMRAKEIALAVGDSDEHKRVEGMRTRLKRLVANGWLNEQNPGQFSIAAGVNSHVVGGVAEI